jgi:hypothetical protein
MFNFIMTNKNPPLFKRGVRGDFESRATYLKSPLTPLYERGEQLTDKIKLKVY